MSSESFRPCNIASKNLGICPVYGAKYAYHTSGLNIFQPYSSDECQFRMKSRFPS